MAIQYLVLTTSTQSTTWNVKYASLPDHYADRRLT
jgi:hypothetical protein